MLNSMKKILESVVSKGIYDFIKYLLFFVIAGITGLISSFFTLHEKYLMPYVVVITIIVVLTLCLLGLLIYKQGSLIYNVYKKTDFKYIFLEKEISYDYTDLKRILYVKRMKLKVKCDNLDRFYDKYNWTGDNNVRIMSSNKSHEVILTTRKDSFQQFEVHFGRSYKKGDIIDLKLIFIMEDNERKADSIVSTTIVEPIKYLRLRVKVSEDNREDLATESIFPIIDSRLALDEKEKEFDEDGVIEWEIKNPPMLLVYSLRWSLPKSKKL